MRCTADQLHDQFGAAFRLESHSKEAHQTPAGIVQQFVYCTLPPAWFLKSSASQAEK